MQFSFIILILFQIYCFYHIYKSKDKAYWYIIILLFPMIGGIIYFAKNAIGRGNFDFQSQQVTPSFSGSNIVELEEQVELSDTVTNKIRLADAYVTRGNFKKAINIYESCFNQFTEDDEELNVKLLAAYYLNDDFVNTIAFGKKLEGFRFFQHAKEKTYYAWAYFELNDDATAERIFQEMNIENTNFYQRKEFAKFLIEIERADEGKAIIRALEQELKDMEPMERKGLHEIVLEIKSIKHRY